MPRCSISCRAIASVSIANDRACSAVSGDSAGEARSSDSAA
jgi:hypothetical protein